MSDKALIPVERIERTILRLRGHNVMLDAVAALYQLDVKVLNQAFKAQSRSVSRRLRVPAHRRGNRIFKVTNCDLKDGPRTTPQVPPVCIHGTGCGDTVERAPEPRAVKVNIEIMRAFVRLRRMLQSNVELARKLDELEMKYDAQFKIVFQAIRDLMMPPPVLRKRIGFRPGKW